MMEDKTPQIKILKDFVADYANAKVSNTSNLSASQSEGCGGIKLPGIFLHPVGSGDAVLAYAIDRKVLDSKQERIFLSFRIGMRDGIPWGTRRNTPNGARFSVYINDEIVFSEDMTESIWKARAIDMQKWLGQDILVEFRTNSIDGNSSYDWCVFGQPMLVSFTGTSDYLSMPENTVGIAIAEIFCQEPSKVSLAMGDISESGSLQPGKHLIPLHFIGIEKVKFIVDSGKAELASITAASHAPQLEIATLALDSPFVNAGKPFKVLLKLKNKGLGIYRENESERLEIVNGKLIAECEIGEIGPGKEKTVIWKGIVIDNPGDCEIVASISDKETSKLHFYAFPPEPEITDNPIVSNKYSRIAFITDDSGEGYGVGYGVAETWDGEKWIRLGSIYPLAEVILQEETLKLKISSLETSGDGLTNSLTIEANAQDKSGKNHPVTITYTPEKDSPRIHVKHQFSAVEDVNLTAFYGVNFLAGHGSFGVKKDFAIFPGLEYLEGDEESSSERDLAYPLNIREVPAIHKITTPLMAVQAQESLIGLMWNSHQEWAKDEKYPAARFRAPKFDSGYSHIRMSLFAPSVGKYVTENEYAARKPYLMKKGEKLHLDAYLILDHKANYANDSVVNGSHKGGLILKAMQHWYDVYGMPEPSKQPRDWESERFLCRDAYFNAVWSENPPGWKHCYGWQPGLFVSHAMPLTLDMKAGVSDEIQKEIDRRISLVIDRAVEEHGKGYLWANAGCHIMMAELPFYYGYLAESLKNFRGNAYQRLAGRENGLWVWHPQDKEHENLGTPGGHTLGQAALSSFTVLRAARLSGDKELIKQALDAMKQMELYEVPRGAQMWECPMYQPDILAAGYAIRAYCEAYRLTKNERYLDQARYWGMTGLPFIYMWELEGYPTMLYNVISVIGSTYFTHSWLGLPVVWCGLVYAYGLLDLAEFDDYFDWKKVAQGIVNSTMWQQYAEGPSKGCYPDSWNMIRNSPNPADINPENILVNEFRLRGLSLEPRCFRFEGKDGFAFLNSGGDLTNISGNVDVGMISFRLSGISGFPVYSIIAPVPEPKIVNGQNTPAEDSDALQKASYGWLYDADLKAIIMKNQIISDYVDCQVKF